MFMSSSRFAETSKVFPALDHETPSNTATPIKKNLDLDKNL